MWYSNATNQDCKALQRVVRLAERISGSALPSLQDIYLKRCKNNQGLKSPWKLSFHSAAIWQALQKRVGKNWETEEELLSSGHQAPKLSLITSTGLNLINCKNTHYSPSSALLLCVHTRYNLFAHSSCTSLVILIFIKSTVDCIAHFSSLHILLILFYCFILSYSYLYLYILSCVMYHLFYFIFLHCPLSGPVLTYISLLIIPCMIVYVTNKQEPWNLQSKSDQPQSDSVLGQLQIRLQLIKNTQISLQSHCDQFQTRLWSRLVSDVSWIRLRWRSDSGQISLSQHVCLSQVFLHDSPAV